MSHIAVSILKSFLTTRKQFFFKNLFPKNCCIFCGCHKNSRYGFFCRFLWYFMCFMMCMYRWTHVKQIMHFSTLSSMRCYILSGLHFSQVSLFVILHCGGYFSNQNAKLLVGLCHFYSICWHHCGHRVFTFIL